MLQSVRLVPVDADVVKSLNDEWLQYLEDAGDELPTAHYRRLVSWASDFPHEQYAKENMYLYALVSDDDGAPHVLALLDVTFKHPTLHDQFCIRVIGINTAPHYDLRQADSAHSNTFTRKRILASLASHLIVLGLDLVQDKNAVELKICASLHVTIDMFTGSQTQELRDALDRTSVNIDNHRNWIVFSLK